MSSPACSPPANPFEAVGRAQRLPSELRVYATTRADRNCQRRTRIARRRVARIVFGLSTDKLRGHVPFEKVLDYNAPGSYVVEAEYERRYGEKRHHDTITRDLEALFGQPTGQLDQKFSHLAGRLGQANTYSVRKVHLTLGRLGRKLMNDLVNYAYSLESGLLPHGAGRLGRISHTGLVEKVLQRALEMAVKGTRHRTGLKMAWVLATLGVPEEAARAAMRDYWTNARALGGRRYEWREARRALESAYRKFKNDRT